MGGGRHILQLGRCLAVGRVRRHRHGKSLHVAAAGRVELPVAGRERLLLGGAVHVELLDERVAPSIGPERPVERLVDRP